MAFSRLILKTWQSKYTEIKLPAFWTLRNSGNCNVEEKQCERFEANINLALSIYTSLLNSLHMEIKDKIANT